MTRRLIALLPLLLLVASCASKPPKADEPEKATPASHITSAPGSNPVGAIPAGVLHDAARNKDLEMTIEYPTRGGPSPVIIFSHALGTSNADYVGLTSFWASHGYVAIKPRHADAAARDEVERIQAPDPKKNPKNEQNAESKAAAERHEQREVVWQAQSEKDIRDRVRDITFIIDSLGKLEEQYPELVGKMDHERIAVAGHSYGAYVALLLAGMTPTRGGALLKLADPRVDAVIAMSPHGTSERLGLMRDSWKDVKIPVLYMTGTRDQGAAENETPDWRHEAFEYSPPGDKYFVSIDGARHLSFTGRVGAFRDEDTRQRSDPFGTSNTGTQQRPMGNRVPITMGERDAFNNIKRTSVTFWESYLKQNAEARKIVDEWEKK
jgi:predicted dienelactone hydrolase